MKIWLTNDKVAWEIPPGRIARYFLRGVYVPPEGWKVTDELDWENWQEGSCGVMRREMMICNEMAV